MAEVLRIWLVPLLAALGATVALAERPTAPLRLALPLECEPGRTCFVQHHVDIEPGPSARDFACGEATYDGHDGVDFRVLSAAAARKGVAVVAAADGDVLRVRDGVADSFARETGKAGIAERECGNGLVISHGEGLETQYCHLLKSSISVRPGQRVERGQRLGAVGYSGMADFAHLHFTVRRAGKAVDPWSGLPGGRHAQADSTCNASPSGSAESAGALWDEQTSRRLEYRAAEVIQAGFAGSIPTWTELERDHEAVVPASPAGPALVMFARVINLAGGDRLRFRLSGPDGFAFDQTMTPVTSHKAIYVAGGGRKLTGSHWPAGRYQGTVEILRRGDVVGRAEAEWIMP